MTKSRRRALVALPILLGLVACGGAESPAPATITPDALAARLESGTAPLVLDVRSEAEYRAGHIPGAVWIPHDQLESRKGELAGREAEEVVVHCQSGRRAAMAEQVLRDAGFRRVIDLEGHWAAWKQAGHPVE